MEYVPHRSLFVKWRAWREWGCSCKSLTFDNIYVIINVVDFKRKRNEGESVEISL
jgi:hypothetical protein